MGTTPGQSARASEKGTAAGDCRKKEKYARVTVISKAAVSREAQKLQKLGNTACVTVMPRYAMCHRYAQLRVGRDTCSNHSDLSWSDQN